MSRRYLTRPEFNAIIAGLRCLQTRMPLSPPDAGQLDDEGVFAILTDADVDPITPDEIDQLVEAINCDEVQLRVEQGT